MRVLNIYLYVDIRDSPSVPNFLSLLFLLWSSDRARVKAPACSDFELGDEFFTAKRALNGGGQTEELNLARLFRH